MTRNGPDTTGNVFCLCPNCHVMLDADAIEDDLTAVCGASLPARCEPTPGT